MLKQLPGQQKLSFGKREAEKEIEEPDHSPKRVMTSEEELTTPVENLEQDISEKISWPVNFEAESSFVDVVKFVVEGHTEEIKKIVNLAKQEIKEKVQCVKNAMDSNARNPNQSISENNPNEPDKEERDINSIINSARNINELCVLLTELQYHEEEKRKNLQRNETCC